MYKECRHIKPNGKKCKSPALRGMPYCYFHTRAHRLVAGQSASTKEPIEMPVLEDMGAIQIAITQTLAALGSSRLDPRRAGLFLYGLQIASKNAAKTLDLAYYSPIRSFTLNSDGDELGPEVLQCDYPTDCPKCPVRKSCEKWEDEDEEEEQDAEEDEAEDEEGDDAQEDAECEDGNGEGEEEVDGDGEEQEEGEAEEGEPDHADAPEVEKKQE